MLKQYFLINCSIFSKSHQPDFFIIIIQTFKMNKILFQLNKETKISTMQFRKLLFEDNNSFCLMILDKQQKQNPIRIALNTNCLSEYCCSENILFELRKKSKQLRLTLPSSQYKLFVQNTIQICQLATLGLLEIKQDEIEKYFIIAMRLKIKKFFEYIIEKNILLDYNDETINYIFKDYYPFFRSIRACDKLFIGWMISTQELTFTLGNIQQILKEKEAIIIFISELIQSVINKRRITNTDIDNILYYLHKCTVDEDNYQQTEEYTQLKLALIPWYKFSLSMILEYRAQFTPLELNTILKLKNQSLNETIPNNNNLNEINNEVQLKKEEVKQALMKRGELKLTHIINSPHLSHPQKKKKTKKLKPVESTKSIEVKLEKSPQKKNTNQYQEFDSLQIFDFKQEPQYIHSIDSCDSKLFYPISCSDLICIQCILIKYFQLTDHYSLPIDFQRVKKSNLVCYICKSKLTEKDVQIINILATYEQE